MRLCFLPIFVSLFALFLVTRFNSCESRLYGHLHGVFLPWKVLSLPFLVLAFIFFSLSDSKRVIVHPLGDISPRLFCGSDRQYLHVLSSINVTKRHTLELRPKQNPISPPSSKPKNIHIYFQAFARVELLQRFNRLV